MRIILLFCLTILASRLFAQEFYIKFPDDRLITDCIAPNDYGTPEVYNPNGATISITYTDVWDFVLPDVCYAIERIWRITLPGYDPQSGICTFVPNPNPNNMANHPSNLPGPIVSPEGTPPPWVPYISKIVPTDPSPTNFSIFWNADTKCYSYKQIIKITDVTDPYLINCPAETVFLPDTSTNDPYLWHEPFWFDSLTGLYDLTEGAAPLSITGRDNCSSTNINIRYLLFLDTDNNGTMETVVNSANPPASGQVNFENAFNPNFMGGIPRSFDRRAVPNNEKYIFGFNSTTFNDGTFYYRTATVAWRTQANPNSTETPQLPAGRHKIKWFIEDGCGNETICEYDFIIARDNGIGYQVITGQIKHDTNNNCVADSTELAMSGGWKAILNKVDNGGNIIDERFSVVGLNNTYRFLVELGTYKLHISRPNDYWSNCQQDTTFSIAQGGDTTTINVPAQSVVDCPFLETSIGTWGLRRCFNNTYNVRYCNMGTTTANSAYISVELDPEMTFVSAGIPYIDEGNQVYRFNIGAIPAGFCGQFPLTVNLNCATTTLGQTHCIESHIYPDSICLPGFWSGANVGVSGACAPDSVVFVLRNTGPVATSLLEYVVIEDNIITRQGSFEIPALDSMLVKVPANGSTWTLLAEQEPGNPYNIYPNAVVEACGVNANGSYSVGFESQFGEVDNDPFVSIDCQQSIGSFDPNDKTGYPIGYGPKHQIEPDQPLDYLIRFQNTGTDTAFRVIVVDTLPEFLDASTISDLVASHSNRFEMLGSGILQFHFNQIMLPDSNVNEPASHGFIKFSIKQRPNLPLGTIIHNSAAIYFDFNEPVITNTTQHTIGVEYILSGVDAPNTPLAYTTLTVMPNPINTPTKLVFKGVNVENGRFELRNSQGSSIIRQSMKGNSVDLEGHHLPAGIYFFQVLDGTRMVGIGKLMVK